MRGRVSRTSKPWDSIGMMAYIFSIDALNWHSSINLPKSTLANPFDEPVTIARLGLDNLFAADFLVDFSAIIRLVLVVELVAELELVIQVL